MTEGKLWEVIEGDCLPVMMGMGAGSVDAIITDLPYGTTGIGWDSIIPFEPMWAAIKHVLKPRGVFITTAAQPFTSALIMSNPKYFKYAMVWKKTLPQGFNHAKNKPLNTHEDILVFSVGGVIAHVGKSERRMTYNPQKKAGEPYTVFRAAGRRVDQHFLNRPSHVDYLSINSGDRYPGSVIEIASERGTGHPTQKPVALYEYLIKSYTNPGELVLDMTAGSGTTGVAAINTGRGFIGIEIRSDYAAIARARLTEAERTPKQLGIGEGI